MSRDLGRERNIPIEDARDESLKKPTRLDAAALRACNSLEALSDLLNGREVSREGANVARQEVLKVQINIERNQTVNIERAPEKEKPSREVERDRSPESLREIVERQKSLDQRLNSAIDKTSVLFGRNADLEKRIRERSDGIPLSVKDQDRVSQIKYVNNSLSEVLSETIKERHEELRKAWSDCDMELAKDSFARQLDGKDLTPKEQANLDLATYLTNTARELPNNGTDISSLLENRARDERTELKIPEIPLDGRSLGTHAIRDEVLAKYDQRGKSEDKINSLKMERRAEYNEKLGELREKYKQDFKVFERIREGGFKCEDERYREYAEKRESIETKWVNDFQGLSGEYREILDNKRALLQESKDKLDPTIVKVLDVMRDNGMKLARDEKDYLDTRDNIDRMSRIIEEREHQFYGVMPERDIPERSISKSAQDELESILKDGGHMRREDDTHIIFARLDRYLNKTVPYDSVKDEALKKVKSSTSVTDRTAASLDIEIGRTDGERLTPLEARREAEKAYNATIHIMDDRGFLTSSEIYKVLSNKMVFDEDGRGLSSNLKAEKPMNELRSLSRSLSKDKDSRFDNIKNFVSRSFNLDRTKEILPERQERKLNSRGADARNEDRTQSIKDFFIDKISDLRERATDKAQKLNETIGDIRQEGWKNWLANQLRETADRLNQPNTAYAGEHYAR